MIKHNTFDRHINEHWTELTNLISSTFQLPYCFITQLKGGEIKISNQNTNSESNKHANSIAKFVKHNCEKVISKKSKRTILKELKEIQQSNTSKIKANTLAYMGYPVFRPDGKIFGTICVLNQQENNFSSDIEELLVHCKDLLELDIATYYSYKQKRISLEEKLNRKLKLGNICSTGKEANGYRQAELPKKDLSKKNIQEQSTCSKLINKMNTAVVAFSPVWAKDGSLSDAVYVDMNQTNEKIIGLQKEKVIGKTILSVFPDTEKEWLENFEKAYKNNQMINFSLHHKQLNKFFSVNTFKLEDNLFCVIYYDISKTVNLNKKLAEQENKYHSLFNTINTAIVLFDPVVDTSGKVIDLIYQDMNPLNEQIMGIKNEEVRNKRMLELYPNTQIEFFDYFSSALKHNKTLTFEFYIKSMDKHFSCSVFPLKDKLAFTSYDISKRVKATEQNKESEERYKSIFENSSSIMLLIDPDDGKIIDANQSAVNFTGYSRSTLLKMSINEINMLDPEEVQSKIKLTKQKKKKYFEFKHKIASGEIKDVEVYSSPIKRNGKILLHSIIHDVTEKKHDHREIIKLSKAVEQAPASIIITDLNGIIEYANPKNCRLTGYELEELIGKNPRILKSGQMPRENYRKMWESISKGKRWSGEFYNRKKDGSYYWEQANIAPIIDDSGKIVNYIKLGKDITKQKELQEELIKAKFKAEESDRLKTAFLANLSHEVRTPLNSILGFNDLLLSNDTHADKKPRYSQIIQESGEQLMMIIDDLVRLSRLESKQFSIKNSYFEVNKLIEEIRDTYEPEVSKKGIRLITDCCSKQKFEIKADRKRIRQVLENLIRNAIKFTDNGSISLLFKCTEKEISFKVKDTGIGIAKENQYIIFERFRQVEEHYTRNYGGNGLGLAISKEIVELMSGKIWLESEAGKGSSFGFTIPILHYRRYE